MIVLSAEDTSRAVARYLSPSISVETFQSGVRDVLMVRDVAFDLLVQALALSPGAFYYVARLSANRLHGLVSQQLALLRQIRSAAGDLVDRRFTPVTRFDDLITARVALTEVDTAAARSASGASTPGITRFSRNIDSFVNRELRPNVVHYRGSDVSVVDTPVSLRRKIQTLWQGVRDLDADIRRSVDLFSKCLSSYSAVRLPERAVRTLVGRLRNRVFEIEESLASGLAEEVAHEAFYDLLVARSLLDRVLNLPRPGLVVASGSSQVAAVGASSGPVFRSVAGPYPVGTELSLNIHIGPDVYPVRIPAGTVLGPGGVAHVHAADVVNAINASNGPFSARVVVEHERSTDVLTLPTPLDDRALDVMAYSELGVTDSGVSTLTVPDWVDLSDAIPGQSKVHLYIGGSHSVHDVVGIAGNVITLSPAPASSPAAPFAITRPAAYVSDDVGRFIELLEHVAVGLTSSLYEVTAIGPGGEWIVSPSFGSVDGSTSFYSARGRVFLDRVELELEPTDHTVSFSGTAAPILGFALHTPATTDRVAIDLGRMADRVTPGDSVILGGTEYSIDGVGPGLVYVSGTQLPSPGTMWSGYRIESLAHRGLLRSIAAVSDLPKVVTPDRDNRVAQVSRGKQAADLKNELDVIIADIEARLQQFAGFEAARDYGVDAAIQMFREHGMDRALDLLLSMDFEELFGMGPDGVSYSSHLIRHSAVAVRAVAPIYSDQREDDELVVSVDS